MIPLILPIPKRNGLKPFKHPSKTLLLLHFPSFHHSNTLTNHSTAKTLPLLPPDPSFNPSVYPYKPFQCKTLPLFDRPLHLFMGLGFWKGHMMICKMLEGFVVLEGSHDQVVLVHAGAHFFILHDGQRNGAAIRL